MKDPNQTSKYRLLIFYASWKIETNEKDSHTVCQGLFPLDDEPYFEFLDGARLAITKDSDTEVIDAMKPWLKSESPTVSPSSGVSEQSASPTQR